MCQKRHLRSDFSKLSPPAPQGRRANAKRFRGLARAQIDTERWNFGQGFYTNAQEIIFYNLGLFDFKWGGGTGKKQLGREQFRKSLGFFSLKIAIKLYINRRKAEILSKWKKIQTKVSNTDGLAKWISFANIFAFQWILK